MSNQTSSDVGGNFNKSSAHSGGRTVISQVSIACFSSSASNNIRFRAISKFLALFTFKTVI